MPKIDVIKAAKKAKVKTVKKGSLAEEKKNNLEQRLAVFDAAVTNFMSK
jgi:hypothetical protein